MDDKPQLFSVVRYQLRNCHGKAKPTGKDFLLIDYSHAIRNQPSMENVTSFDEVTS